MRKRTLVATIGDANDVRTGNGSAYHLLKEGQRRDVLDAGLPLVANALSWSLRNVFWSTAAKARGRGALDHQVAVRFLERLWSPVRAETRGARVLNCFALYPPSIVADDLVERWYYIDQTLEQAFSRADRRKRAGSAAMAEAMERERVGYERAAGIIAQSDWVAQSVIRDYGIPTCKVSVAVPGANLDPDIYDAWSAQRPSLDGEAASPLRLVFVARDPLHDGLDRLLRALAHARARGAHCTLRIIGGSPDDLPVDCRDIAGVEWAAPVDRFLKAEAYMDMIAEGHVGCLLSQGAPLDTRLREFHALGLAVIASAGGGATDHVLREAAVLVGAHDATEQLSSVLQRLAGDLDLVRRLRKIAWARRDEVSWTATIRKIAERLGA